VKSRVSSLTPTLVTNAVNPVGSDVATVSVFSTTADVVEV
jgi:hypothetical protein